MTTPAVVTNRVDFSPSTNNTRGPVTIIYHAHCNDGFAAAFGIASSMRRTCSSVRFVPYEYGVNTLPANIRDIAARQSQVFVVDVSLSLAEMAALVRSVEHVTWIDHHKTAAGFITPYASLGVATVFDESHSAAGLVAAIVGDELMPCEAQILRHVEDRDLWAFELEHTREIHAYLCTLEKTFTAWDVATSCVAFRDMCHMGAVLLTAQAQLVEYYVAQATPGALGDMPCLFVNGCAPLASEIGAKVLEGQTGYAVAVVYWREPDYMKFSIRAVKGSAVDVSKLAKRFGGGGHPAAAGFRVPIVSDDGPFLDWAHDFTYGLFD